MGLDMYVVAIRKGRYEENGASFIDDDIDADGDDQQDLCYWRKFNALHNWMEQLYRTKSGDDEEEFNCIKILLNQEDLDALEEVCLNKKLVPKEGFFFGSQEPVTDDEYEDLLKDIGKMREAVRDGFYVYYDSWW